MPTIYCLAGVSGAGKTYTRTHDPKLKCLACLDVADYYQQNPGINPYEAWFMLENDLIQLLDGGKDIVVEAWFKPGGFQRARIKMLAEHNGYEVTWIELQVSRDICRERILADYIQNAAAEPEKTAQLLCRRDARLRLLDIADW